MRVYDTDSRAHEMMQWQSHCDRCRRPLTHPVTVWTVPVNSGGHFARIIECSKCAEKPDQK